MKGYSTVSLAEFNKVFCSCPIKQHRTTETDTIIFQYGVDYKIKHEVNIVCVSQSHISLTCSMVSELLFCVAVILL